MAEEPRKEKEVIIERDRKGVTGTIIAVVVVIILLFLLFGGAFGGSGGVPTGTTAP